MNQSKDITIALDGSKVDDDLLRYGHFIAPLLGARQVTGLHVVPTYLIGELVKVEVGKVLNPVAPALGKIQKQLTQKSHQYFDNAEIETEVQLTEGHPYRKLLATLESTQPDLLLLGRKKISSGSGIVAKRVARNCQADLMFIPEGIQPSIKRIVVATDFSDNANVALERALFLHQQLGLKNPIECIYVYPILGEQYDLDRDYYWEKNAGKLPPYFEILHKKFEDQHRDIKDKLNLAIISSRTQNITKVIKAYTEEVEADIIIVGAKGHNFLESFVLGSVTEKLVDSFYHKPIYVVRNDDLSSEKTNGKLIY